MSNRLAWEKSPHLTQHADNPVAWYPWGAEAFAKADAEDKPVFLSIGYSTCHWCHVMERESFEDAEVAELLNREFVCIKVDREERPDIDAVYMQVCQAMTGSGGWAADDSDGRRSEAVFCGNVSAEEDTVGQTRADGTSAGDRPALEGGTSPGSYCGR